MPVLCLCGKVYSRKNHTKQLVPADFGFPGLQCAVYGSFSAPKVQEIIVSRGKVLELLRPDDNGKVQTILSTEVFGAIRALSAFRLTGGSRDFLIVGSDSGRIVILDYVKEKNAFVKLHQETFGKSGCRQVLLSLLPILLL